MNLGTDSYTTKHQSNDGIEPYVILIPWSLPGHGNDSLKVIPLYDYDGDTHIQNNIDLCVAT